MAKTSNSIAEMPPVLIRQLRNMGAHIRLARERRGFGLKELAERVSISHTTLMRLEAGRPSVSLGVLASVLWLLGLNSSLENLANPDADEAGKIAESRRRKQKNAKSKNQGDADPLDITQRIKGLDY